MFVIKMSKLLPEPISAGCVPKQHLQIRSKVKESVSNIKHEVYVEL